METWWIYLWIVISVNLSNTKIYGHFKFCVSLDYIWFFSQVLFHFDHFVQFLDGSLKGILQTGDSCLVTCKEFWSLLSKRLTSNVSSHLKKKKVIYSPNYWSAILVSHAHMLIVIWHSMSFVIKKWRKKKRGLLGTNGKNET